MVRALFVCALIPVALTLSSCKQSLNPHVTVEPDPEFLLKQNMLAGQSSSSNAAAAGQLALTLNNAPTANEPLLQELAQREVDIFQGQNTGVRIDFSTWRFTPQSFFDRASDRTLTDLVEVDLEQLGPIIDLSFASDITDLAIESPEYKALTPEMKRLVTRNGRVYAMPVQVHSMALFYNRRIFETKAINPEIPKNTNERRKSSGAEGEPRDYLHPQLSENELKAIVLSSAETNLDDESPKVVAQLFPFFRRQQQEEPREQQPRRGRRDRTSDEAQTEETPAPRSRVRRGEQEVQDYYNLPRQPQDSRRDVRSMYDTEESPDSAVPGAMQPPGRSTAPRRPIVVEVESADDLASADPFSPLTTNLTPTTAPVSIAFEEVVKSGTPVADVTTASLPADLPNDWQALIRAAVKYTDHSRKQYGYAPTLFAEEGGREFAQWAAMAGLEIQTSVNGKISYDLNSPRASEVVEFIKDLKWKYDVTPPIDKCYYDSLVQMFAQGKVAMMMMPANRETIQRLLRSGMKLEDLGIAPLPAGPANRKHLVFGKALILNTQLERTKRVSAYRYVQFALGMERRRQAAQFLFNERELTGVPELPIFEPVRQRFMDESIKQYRLVPQFPYYTSVAGQAVHPEPPFFTQRFYESIASGVRNMVERSDSQPRTEISQLGADFDKKYLQPLPREDSLQSYMKMITGRLGNSP